MMSQLRVPVPVRDVKLSFATSAFCFVLPYGELRLRSADLTILLHIWFEVLHACAANPLELIAVSLPASSAGSASSIPAWR